MDRRGVELIIIMKDDDVVAAAGAFLRKCVVAVVVVVIRPFRRATTEEKDEEAIFTEASEISDMIIDLLQRLDLILRGTCTENPVSAPAQLIFNREDI